MTEPRPSSAAPRLAILALLAAAGVGAVVLLPLDRVVADVLAAVGKLGPLGPVLLAAAWVPAALLFLPGSALSHCAGCVFGLPHGIATV